MRRCRAPGTQLHQTPGTNFHSTFSLAFCHSFPYARSIYPSSTRTEVPDRIYANIANANNPKPQPPAAVANAVLQIVKPRKLGCRTTPQTPPVYTLPLFFASFRNRYLLKSAMKWRPRPVTKKMGVHLNIVGDQVGLRDAKYTKRRA